MKKLFKAFVTLLTFVCFITIVNASDVSTTLSGKTEIYKEGEVTITLAVNGTNIWGLIGELKYDESKLKLVKSEGLNGFNATVGKKIVLDSASGKDGKFNIITLTFKATSSFNAGESTKVSVENVSASSDSMIMSADNASTTIKVLEAKSSNNYLSELTIDGKKIDGFKKSDTSYKLVVENSTDSIKIAAKAEDSKASIKGIGTKKLSVYSNSYSVVVTAENGSSKTYKITVIRKDSEGREKALSSDNTLSKLEVVGYSINFKKDTTNYTLDVESTVNKLEVNAQVSNSSAKYTITNPTLAPGENKIIIVVTAENGTTKEYTITVNKKTAGEPVTKTVTMDTLLDAINDDSTDIIELKLENDTKISKDVLDKLAGKNKKLNIVKYENDKVSYSWSIDGNELTSGFEIDTKITFDSENDELLKDLVKDKNVKSIVFSHSGQLPKGTIITVYVGDKYKDGDYIDLYYLNTETKQLELKSKSIQVTNGYVKLSIDHCSEYVLEQSETNTIEEETNSNILYYIIAGALLLVIIVIIVVRNKKKND